MLLKHFYKFSPGNATNNIILLGAGYLHAKFSLGCTGTTGQVIPLENGNCHCTNLCLLLSSSEVLSMLYSISPTGWMDMMQEPYYSFEYASAVSEKPLVCTHLIYVHVHIHTTSNRNDNHWVYLDLCHLHAYQILLILETTCFLEKTSLTSCMVNYFTLLVLNISFSYLPASK